MNKLYLFCLFFTGTFLLQAQPDSNLLLRPERLLEKDIIRQDVGIYSSQAVSGTRSLENLDDLPFTIWVITGEDIARYGFVTLGDVLRAAPGMRVSQMGNAEEGEMFMMRGLSGNEYVKILINDVPVKPAYARGMPIGAQLPIRQAERIEVMYGPASSIYGNEACAGVVNIILKETERPVFTQADLSFGKYGYNSLDLMFGGKLGKDKRVLRYSLFGSSTIRDDSDVFNNTDLFTMNNYVPFGLDSSVYRYNRNYIADSDVPNIPKLAKVAHQSRLFGVTLAYKGLKINYERWYRNDFSSLGANPLVYSWSNPADQLNERIETIALSLTRQRKRWQVNTNMSVQYYQVNNSTNTMIFNGLSRNLYEIRRPYITNDSLYRQFLNTANQFYNMEQRFVYARAADARLETRLNTVLQRNLFLETALQVQLSTGTPLTRHSIVPVETNFLGFSDYSNYGFPYSPYNGANLDATAFGQLEWRGPKLKIIAGTSLNYAPLINLSPVLAPRGAVLYKIDSFFSVFGNFTTGFRRPNAYNFANSFTLRRADGNINSGPSLLYDPEGWFVKTERTESFEGGMRYKKDGKSVQLSCFSQSVYYYVRPNQYQEIVSYQSVINGFNNIPGKGQHIWGIQGLLTLENSKNELNFGKKVRTITSKTEFYAQYSKGKEWLEPGQSPLNDVLNMPRWITQFRSSWRTGKFQLMIASNRQSSNTSKSITYKSRYQLNNFILRYGTYRTWDVVARVYLDKHFVLYAQMQNLFNRHYSGLDAYGTPDDLIYNPQQGRIWRIGVSYNMN